MLLTNDWLGFKFFYANLKADYHERDVKSVHLAITVKDFGQVDLNKPVISVRR